MPTLFNPPSTEVYSAQVRTLEPGKSLNCLLYALGLGGNQFAVSPESEKYDLDYKVEISEAFQKKAEELLGYKFPLRRVGRMEEIPAGHYAFALFGFNKVKKKKRHAAILGWDDEYSDYSDEIWKTAYDFHVMRLDPADSTREARWTHKAGWDALPSEVSQQDWDSFSEEYEMKPIFLVLEE